MNTHLKTVFIAIGIVMVVIVWPVQAQDSEGIALSGQGGKSPDITANEFYAVLAYVENGNVLLRSASARNQAWTDPTNLAAGSSPKVLFNPNQPFNHVHVLWVNAQTRQILYTTCTLAEGDPPTCEASQTVGADDVLEVDITVDNDNNLYAAWNVSSSGGGIQVATLLANQDNWQNLPLIRGSGVVTNPTKPSLAASPNFLHLAFENNQGKEIIYYRYPLETTNPTWNEIERYTAADFLLATLQEVEELRNPVVIVDGETVNLAWDVWHGNKVTVDDLTVDYAFGLAFAVSTNEGQTWPSAPVYAVTDTPTTNSPGVVDTRLAKVPNIVTLPSEEIALRPDIALKNGGGVGLVWQQRPHHVCAFFDGKNGTSEIYYVDYINNSWQNVEILVNSTQAYDIDPAVALDPNNQRHVTFMRAEPPAFDVDECGEGGNADADYFIYYHGPYRKLVSGETSGDPVLSITKSGPVTSTVNNLVTYDITVTNSGNGPANSVQIFDPIPDGATYVEGGDAVIANQVVWAVGTLPANQQINLNYVVQVDVGTTMIVNGNARVTASDGHQVTETTNVTTEIVSTGPILGITKVGPATAEVGEQITYILAVANTGTGEATNLTVSDVLPDGATYIKGGTLNGNMVTWQIGSLAPQGGLITTSFSVAAQETIVNNDYWVEIDGTNRVSGETSVTTVIDTAEGCDPTDPKDPICPPFYLPAVLKQ